MENHCVCSDGLKLPADETHLKFIVYKSILKVHAFADNSIYVCLCAICVQVIKPC